MVDTRSLLDGFLGGRGQSGIGSLGGGGGGGSLGDVLGGLFGGRSGGGIGSLGSGGGGGGIFGGPIGSLGDEGGRGGGIFGGPIGSLGDEGGRGGGMFGGPIGSLGRGEDGGAMQVPTRDEGGGMFGGSGGGLGGMLGGGGLGGGLGGIAAGGLLGSLLGGGRRSAGGGGGLLRMGGMAVLGTLAYRAWKQFQESQGMPQPGAPGAPAPAGAPASGPWSGGKAAPGGAWGHGTALPQEAEFARDDVPAADGHPFGLSVIKAMVSAAKADGHMDDAERNRVFDEVEKLGLDADAKGFVFQALDAPADPSAIAALARTDAQKSEIYMASRLVAEPDTAAERAYLDALAHRLGLAPGLRQSLDAQAAEAARLVASGAVPAANT